MSSCLGSETVAELFPELRHLGIDHNLAILLTRVVTVVVGVIHLGRLELGDGLDLGDHGIRIVTPHLSHDGLGSSSLRLRVMQYDRPVLGA